jgi:hypothetical protein
MKRQLIFFLSVAVLFASCSKDKETPTPGLSAYENSLIAYFKEIALGFEFGNASELTRKWPSKMKVFVGGDTNPVLLNELEKIKNEINTLATDGFSIEIVTDSLQSNYYVFFGSGEAYAKKYTYTQNLIATNFGLFTLFFNGSNHFTSGHMYVDIFRANATAQKHLLREEFTQSLGLAKDSPLYPESIFQADWTTTTEYTQMDRDLIRLLYHPKMKAGLNKAQADIVLRKILLND